MTQTNPSGPVERDVGRKARAWRTTAMGLECITFAESAGRARTNTVRAAQDAGYSVRYPDVRVIRAPEYDRFERFAEIHRARRTCFDPHYLAKELNPNASPASK